MHFSIDHVHFIIGIRYVRGDGKTFHSLEKHEPRTRGWDAVDIWHKHMYFSLTELSWLFMGMRGGKTVHA